MRDQPSALFDGRAAAAAGATLLCGAAVALAGEGESLDPGTIGQAIATIAIFVVLLLILGRWAWKPIITQLRRREEIVAGVVQRAEQREVEAQQILEDYRAQLQRAQAESEQLLSKAGEEADAQRKRIVAEARGEAAAAAREATAEIERAKQEVVEELHESAARLAAEIAEGILRRSISPADRERLMAESLQEIRRRMEGQDG